MVSYEAFELENGLKVIVHEEPTVETVAVNVLYKVGSRNEQEDRTGFAHLFEHLMFGGSLNIPDYDGPLQKVGGQNNAFTTPDITNYYITLPAVNLETAFWLESDRMLGLAFNEKSLEVQRKVVIEEFKQRYLNQPYGDMWLNLRPLAYKKHPYNWATIGKDISHIENATMEDVRSFFRTFYVPNNAVLVVAGKVSLSQIKELAEKWFGPIPKGNNLVTELPTEPQQNEERRLMLEKKVPLNMIVKAFHMPGRSSEEYYATDLLSDILGRGKSSRLFKSLVKQQKIFNDAGAYVSGSIDPGLLVISGKTNGKESIENAELAIDQIISDVTSIGIKKTELDKVKNQAESSALFNRIDVLNRGMGLAYGWVLGDIDIINNEVDKVRSVSENQVNAIAEKILRKENSSVLIYKSMVA